MPKKKGHPCKKHLQPVESIDTDAAKGHALDRKSPQEMEATKHVKASENAKEKLLRQYTDRSRRHARQCARAL